MSAPREGWLRAAGGIAAVVALVAMRAGHGRPDGAAAAGQIRAPKASAPRRDPAAPETPWRMGGKTAIGFGAGALVAALALVVVAVIAPQAAAGGWRVGFLFAGSVPIGAVALLLIARVSGGTWPAPLMPWAVAVPILLPAAIPLIVAQNLIAAPPHLATYLSPPWFGARAIVALAVWSVLGWMLAAGRMRCGLGAALGLLAHGVLVSVLAYDWVLGADPGQPYSAIGMALAVQQIVAAAATACLVGVGGRRALDDLSKLMIAGCLGFAYLLFVDWLIVWYGNLPSRVDAYLARMARGWGALPPVALAFGLIAPIAAKIVLSPQAGRRVAGACALIGLFIADLWLVGPQGGALAALAALLTAVLLGAPIAILAGRRATKGISDAA